MRFLLALQFLTRVPVKLKEPFDGRDMARAAAYFPAVGLLLGTSAAAMNYFLSMALAPPVCDLFTVAFLAAVTGNMHGDGLMDTADGIFSGQSRDRILEIMKDSRVGSHGVTAGVTVLLAKFVLLGQLTQDEKIISLILAPALGRWAQVYAASAHPYVRPGGGTGSFTHYIGGRELFLASAITLFPTIILLGVPGGSLLALAAIPGTVILGRYLAGKIGGMTGDTLGAVNECVEVLGLLILQFVFKL